MNNRELLQRAYAAFNRRDIEDVLELMREDVEWPNAMEGTILHGKAAVREYWKHQWQAVDPHVEPVEVTDLPGGRSVVRVNQIVKTLQGAIISEGLLDHEYLFKDGLIARMEVRDDSPDNRFQQSQAKV